ncbi:MAG: hypothetical protein EOP94_00290 [Zymomonas sp.]|nr:MAG: hypothetical protein EOP94_00290 [Zymomonas sp.]
MQDASDWDQALQLDLVLSDDAMRWVAQGLALQVLVGNQPLVRKFSDLTARLQQIRRARCEPMN